MSFWRKTEKNTGLIRCAGYWESAGAVIINEEGKEKVTGRKKMRRYLK